jgi:hypothetical protein
MQRKRIIRVARSNTLRPDPIKVYRAVNPLSLSVQIAEKPSVKNARWNAVGILTASPATSTTMRIAAYANLSKVSAVFTNEPKPLRVVRLYKTKWRSRSHSLKLSF